MSARTWHKKEIADLKRVENAQYERMLTNFVVIQDAVQGTSLENPMEALKERQIEVQNWAVELGRREQNGTPLSPRALEFEAWLTASNERSAKTRKFHKIYCRLEVVASAQLFVVAKVLCWVLKAVKVAQQRSVFTAFFKKAFKPTRLKAPKSPLEYRLQTQTNAPNIAA